MKILFITGETVPWATTNRAYQIREQLPHHDIDILNRQSSPSDEPAFNKYDLIHILYSGGCTRNSWLFDKYGGRVLASLTSVRTITGTYEPVPALIDFLQQVRGGSRSKSRPGENALPDDKGQKQSSLYS
jgi:hypothetical protein